MCPKLLHHLLNKWRKKSLPLNGQMVRNSRNPERKQQNRKWKTNIIVKNIGNPFVRIYYPTDACWLNVKWTILIEINWNQWHFIKIKGSLKRAIDFWFVKNVSFGNLNVLNNDIQYFIDIWVNGSIGDIRVSNFRNKNLYVRLLGKIDFYVWWLIKFWILTAWNHYLIFRLIKSIAKLQFECSFNFSCTIMLC